MLDLMKCMRKIERKRQMLLRPRIRICMLRIDYGIIDGLVIKL